MSKRQYIFDMVGVAFVLSLELWYSLVTIIGVLYGS